MKTIVYQRKDKQGNVVSTGIKYQNTLPTKTQKSHAPMVNVNNILKKYRQTGIITHITSKDGTYGDFSEMKDFAGALNTVIKAREQFSLLPAEVRSRFSNNPELLIKFLQDPKNVDESIRLGLRFKKEEPVKPKRDNIQASVNTAPSQSTNGTSPSQDSSSD